jgi:hypothetical protein
MPHWDAEKVDHLETIADDARDDPATLAGGGHLRGHLDGHERGRRAPARGPASGPDAVIVTLAVDSGFKYLSVPPYLDL